MQRNVWLRNLKFLRFPIFLFLLGATVSLSNCRTVAEPTGNSKTDCARINDEICLSVQHSPDEQASGLGEPVRRADLERKRQIIEESATSSAELLIKRAEDVSASIKNAQIYCEEVKLGWLDIEVEILSGLCESDCVASSLFLQGRVPWLIRGDFFRAYQERDSFENWVHHPEVFRGTSVMRVDFAADGSSIASSVVLEEKRGGFDAGIWFDGMAESAELRNPVGGECAVRVSFKANLAHFSGHRNHRH